MTVPPDVADAAPLQFDAVEPVSPQASTMSCGNCKAPLHSEYHQLNSHVLCSPCRKGLEEKLGSRSLDPGAIAKATLFGFGAAVLGAVLYFGVLAVTGLNVGIVAIAVGYMVGKMVRKGAGGTGGRVYQVIAVALTYLAIDAIYAFAVLDSGEYHGAGLLGALLAAPVLTSFNPIRLLIIAFGLVQAWSLAAPAVLRFTGPFRVAQPVPVPAAAAAGE